MNKYAYVYSKHMTDKIHILSMQLTICEYLKDLFDTYTIEEITDDIIKNYDVICMDGFLFYELWFPEHILYKQLDIIKQCKNICIMTRDLHETSFDATIKNYINPNLVNGIFRPPKNILSGYTKCKLILEKYNIKNIISLYDCDEFTRLINFTKCKPYILNLHVDTKIFTNLNMCRDIDILIYGADYYPMYPRRNTIKNVVKTMNITYHIIDANIFHNANTCDHGLAKLLNRSWLTLCTCSVYDYLVLKYFEASACGSVVVGNMAQQGKNIWQNNYIDIPNDASNDEIKKIIYDALADKEKLLSISQIMYDKISSEYNYSQYAKKLKNICDDIVNKLI